MMLIASYADLRGKMLGVTEHADSMKDVSCPVDSDHVPDIVHGKTGQFKYVPNGDARQVHGSKADFQGVREWKLDCLCCSIMECCKTASHPRNLSS